MIVEDPREGPSELRMQVAAGISSWRLGESKRARCARASAEGPREGPIVSRMPSGAKS